MNSPIKIPVELKTRHRVLAWENKNKNKKNDPHCLDWVI